MERGFDHLSGIGAEIAATILHVKLMFSKDDVETLDREVDSLVELTMRQSKISSLDRHFNQVHQEILGIILSYCLVPKNPSLSKFSKKHSKTSTDTESPSD